MIYKGGNAVPSVRGDLFERGEKRGCSSGWTGRDLALLVSGIKKNITALTISAAQSHFYFCPLVILL